MLSIISINNRYFQINSSITIFPFLCPYISDCANPKLYFLRKITCFHTILNSIIPPIWKINVIFVYNIHIIVTLRVRICHYWNMYRVFHIYFSINDCPQLHLHLIHFVYKFATKKFLFMSHYHIICDSCFFKRLKLWCPYSIFSFG